MQLKTGMKLRSQVGPTEVVVVKAPTDDAPVTCGGHPMVAADQAPGTTLPTLDDASENTLIGKRYTDDAGLIEVLVTKPGVGTLALGTDVLGLKQAKPLPASD